MLSKKKKADAVLLGRRQEKLGKYGVLKLKGDKVLDLIEKPVKGKEPSDTRLIGIYFFSKSFLETLGKMPDEHYSLEKAISTFVKENDVRIVITRKEAPSLKYAWDLLELKNYLLTSVSGRKISKKAKISKMASITGNVVIEDGVAVMEGAKVKGPCFIGKNSVIGNNVVLRNGTCIEENCVIGANMEVKNSLIMKNTKVHSGFIGDSIVGENVRIGAGFHSANKRIDRQNIPVVSPDGVKINTGLNILGAIIGNGVRMGIRVSTMPGVMIGKNSIIGPATNVLNNVPSDTKYYAKFKEIVEKIK